MGDCCCCDEAKLVGVVDEIDEMEEKGDDGGSVVKEG